MSSAQVGAVLRHIRKLASTRHDHDVPDRQLLERFVLHRDGDAFAALLGRHGPMVLGVCQSVLHNVHDAEDAFQAAFLLLARKAGSIHRREAVSGWLYRVAYHLAVRSQANAARRRVHEKRAATMPSADPLLDLSLREVRRILFEEMEHLPEEYRAPLVLCGLEERSREEAARLLGWSLGGLKGKLERGRELLRARLRRRGLELPAGLLATALALHSASGRVSAALADGTLRAALKLAAGKGAVAGVASAQVAALVQGASKTMFHSKAKMATALFLAMGVTAAALGVVRHRAAAADRPAAEQSPATKAPANAERPVPDTRPGPAVASAAEVRGRVLNPDGQPVAGARLYLARAVPTGPAPSHRATSGADGRFHFTVARSELDPAGGSDSPPPQVMAVAKGYGCAWDQVRPTGRDLTLRLVADAPVSGRILDQDGRPVVGAKVRVTGASGTKSDDLDGYLEAVRKGNGWRYAFAQRWTGPLPGTQAVLTTGADGRFKLAGVGRERVVNVRLEGPAIAWAELAVMTRPSAKVGDLYGASFDYVGAASRLVRGVVRDKATGRPLPGVSVAVELRRWFGNNRWCKAVTDKQGRYELVGLDKAPRYPLELKPPDGLYFQRRAEFTDTPGLGPLTADVGMLRGLTVRGRVTDKRTGKPIAHARVDYHPLYPNPHANKELGFWAPRSEATTAADGSYALTVLPGQGAVGVTAPKPEAYTSAVVTLRERKDFFKVPIAQDSEDWLPVAVGSNAQDVGIIPAAYNAIVLIEPGDKDKALVRDVALEAPRELKGRVVGPDGRPLAGVSVRGLYRNDEETLKGAEFTVRGVNPKAHRSLVFRHKERDLGFFLKDLRGHASGPLTIRLQPCGSASGRLVDSDGQPLVGERLGFDGVLAATIGLGGHVEATTGKDGRFHIRGLVPGMDYGVYGVTRAGVGRGLGHLIAQPGKNKDLGDLKLDR